MNASLLTPCKIWPLDADGNPLMERPSFQQVPVPGVGAWCIYRYQDGTWSAKFTPESVGLSRV